MRKVILSILLAGVAASPALAQDQGDRRHHDQQQQQGNRGDHGNRGQGRQDNRQAPSQQQRFVPQGQQVQQGRGNFGQRFNGGDNVARGQVIQQQQVQQQQAFQRGRRFDGQQGERVQQQGFRNGYAGAYGGRSGQWQQQQGFRNQGSRVASNWNRNWRNDGRYDWRRYRDSHRSIFSLGLYVDPFGYGYQPFDIGYDLPPVYFGQQYWIDPAMYELPYPPPGATWVRYWNDAVLVDTYSGQVIDVIHDFFW
jgi:Ni/Co efflux regulator RcnB